ncbi:MAG: prephenate dehydrogenase/arogenate dehydrogenase family protein [Candidatus Xiphinematobacter sp.]|nr:MAG: prephenate dehydrogenase/arogenate dehydrogenase family protein [Candidatus Xiphinematobacter sp.]QQY11012.1 MAG: prephenate dehydrogenase/arogenate dehydrogenase family protein [Candidatus Xiphinematobacter sp.]
MFPKTVAILAPGLIGGSLALALARRGGWKIHVWARGETSLQKAKTLLQPLKASLQFEEVIPGAKVIVLCSPVSAMGRLARKIRPFLDVDAVVTDVGSIKVFVTRELVPILGDCFLGGHPMAGSERSGLEAARWDLFLQAPCILTPLGPAHHPAVISRLEKVRDLWDSAGARIFEMTPEQHDTAVAFVSHLPHVTAAALVSTICSQPPSLQEIAGGGYRDATRIAQGAADLWLDVLLENREAILAALSHYDDQLRTLSHLLKMSDTEGLYNFLEKASVARSLLKN